MAQKSPVRERIGSDRQWFLVFQGRELPISGSVLDYAPKNSDSWAESDGSAGLRGFVVKSDKYAEAKAILAAMISAGAGAFAETTTLLSPLGGAMQLNNGGIDSAFSAGLQAGGQIWSASTRTPSTSAFPRAPRFTSMSRKRSIWARPLLAFPLRSYRQTTRLPYIHEILSRHYPTLAPGAPRGRKSGHCGRWKFPAPPSQRRKRRKFARRK